MLELLSIHPGPAGIALEGTVRLPAGLHVGENELELVAHDEGGNWFDVRKRSKEGDSLAFDIPDGFPRVQGEVTLQLLEGNRVRGRVGLGRLVPASTEFAVANSERVRAFFRGSLLVVQYKAPISPGDELILRPLRTERFAWPLDSRVPFKQLGNELCEVELDRPYLQGATRLEFEISERRYIPDEFVISGASLEDGALVVPEGVARSREGRRIHLPSQRAPISRYGVVILVGDTDSPDGWERRPTELISPKPEALGLNIVWVTMQPSHPKASDEQPGGGGGREVPSKDWDPARLRLGPTGTLRFAMPPSKEPEPVVTRFAIPIEG